MLLFLFCDIIVFKTWLIFVRKRVNPDSVNPDKTLLIVRVDAIGDYILFRNYLSVIKNSHEFKGYRITLCGNENWKDIAENLDGFIDSFIWISRKKFQYCYKYRISILRYINGLNFSITINPAFSRDFFISDSLVFGTGSIDRIGFNGDLVNISGILKVISDKFYTRLIQPDKTVKFEFYRNYEFFEKLLGEKPGLTGPEIDSSRLKSGLIDSRDYAVIFPGSSSIKKTWNYRNFIVIANYLREKYKVDIVLCGDGHDRLFADKIEKEVINSVNLCGKTTLVELISVLSKSRILISNDTSAVHIAAALKTPVVYILNGILYGRFGPYPDIMKLPVKSVYPDFIENFRGDLSFLYKKFRKKTGLDINDVNAGSVIKAVDILMLKKGF